MNPSITTKDYLQYDKYKQSNRHRIKQNDNLSAKMVYLCDSIKNLCHQTDVSFDDILKSSDSILGKLYQLFLSLSDQKSHLLNPIVFDEFIRKKTAGSLIIRFNQMNKLSMNFIEFIKQIEFLAKENQLSKEYLYKKLLHSTLFNKNQNQSNNALDFSSINEYNTDFDHLKTYFITYNESNDHQMSCSTFIKCISENLKLNSIEYHLQLNDILNQIYSLFVNQGVYIPASHTIDFHGFILCLQHIARLFHLNLRILIKTLINSKK